MGLHTGQIRQFESAPWVLQRSCGCGKQSSECGCEGNKALRSAPPIVEDVLQSSGQPLDASTRAFMEDRFGHDFSKVRVHSDARAASSARAVDAHAYTVGSQVVFGAGRYSPAQAEGQRLLAHELAHVVQQSQGDAIASGDDFAESEAKGAESVIGNSGSAGVSARAEPNRLQRAPDEGSTTTTSAPSPTAKVPFCPTPPIFEEKPDFSDKKIREAWTDTHCLTPASKAMPPVCQFTKAQTKALAEAQKTAAGRVERALGIINMGPEGKKMATEMANQLFESDPPTLVEVVDRLTRTRDFLKTTKVEFAGRTCGDSGCQHLAPTMYVTGPGTLPIYVCPTAFSKPSSLHRTVLHESLHWTGLDADPTTPEGYCKEFDCKTPCLDKEVADAWAHYVDCLGKPFEVRKDFRQKIIESVEDLP